MKRRSILAAGSVLAAPKTRDQFLGVWKLITYERQSASGPVEHPFSTQPIGRITYDKAGRMSAQLMRPARKSAMPVGVSYANGSAPDAEIREAVSGFIAYYGKFEVDEAAATVTHHVEACLVPSWVGHDLIRKYAFQGRRLTLTASTGAFSVKLIWEREAD